MHTTIMWGKRGVLHLESEKTRSHHHIHFHKQITPPHYETTHAYFPSYYLQTRSNKHNGAHGTTKLREH